MAETKPRREPVQTTLFDFLKGFEPHATPEQEEEDGGFEPPPQPAREGQARGFEPSALPARGSARLALISPDEIFDRANQELLRNLREDRRLERKPIGIQPRALGDYLCMWANTPPDGGVIVVGQNDDGSFAGCLSASGQHLNDLETAGRLFCPSARVETKRVHVLRTKDEGEDFVLLFRVYHRETGVTENNKGEAYIRIGDRKEKISESMKRELQNDRGEISFESEPSRLSFPDDFDLDLVRHFAESVHRTDRLSMHHEIEEILEMKRLGRRKDGRFLPNVACEILFARDPALHFPGSKIRFFRFEGEEEGTGERFNAVKDVWIEGPAPKLITEADHVMKSQLREFSWLGRDNKFYTAKEYPDTAWYEAIVNAVCHRSYGLRNMNIYIKMFDNRLEVESPGGFPPLITPETIYHISNPRNRHLAEALYYFDFVKLANEGTRRMRESMQLAALPAPEFQQRETTHAMVTVTLRNDVKQRRVWIDSEIGDLVGAAIVKDLNQKERRALSFIAEHQTINVSQAMRLTGLSWKSSKKMLLRLTTKGILVQVKRPELDRDPEAHYALRVRTRK